MTTGVVPQQGKPFGQVEWTVERLQKMAARLSREGWRFYKQTGPLGFYYVGYRGTGPRRARIQTEQNADERVALKNAIVHAATY